MAETIESKSSRALIAGAWILVIVPTLWGLNYTVQNAAKLFSAPSPAAAPSSANPAAPK